LRGNGFERVQADGLYCAPGTEGFSPLAGKWV